LFNFWTAATAAPASIIPIPHNPVVIVEPSFNSASTS